MKMPGSVAVMFGCATQPTRDGGQSPFPPPSRSGLRDAQADFAGCSAYDRGVPRLLVTTRRRVARQLATIQGGAEDGGVCAFPEISVLGPQVPRSACANCVSGEGTSEECSETFDLERRFRRCFVASSLRSFSARCETPRLYLRNQRPDEIVELHIRRILPRVHDRCPAESGGMAH